MWNTSRYFIHYVLGSQLGFQKLGFRQNPSQGKKILPRTTNHLSIILKVSKDFCKFSWVCFQTSFKILIYKKHIFYPKIKVKVINSGVLHRFSLLGYYLKKSSGNILSKFLYELSLALGIKK